MGVRLPLYVKDVDNESDNVLLHVGEGVSVAVHVGVGVEEDVCETVHVIVTDGETVNE